jgi:2,3-bisphosphoglycerate-dependent phosphoglycerate mutase
MKIYFVRHGESELNAKHIHQPHTAQLSDLGKKQAAFVAHRFSSIPVDIIYSSPFARALETATEIAQITEKKIVQEPLLRELKRPTEIEGKPIDDPAIQSLKQQIIDHTADPDWHYADEENIHDLKNRCLNIVALLKSLEYEHVVVVTHGITLRMIIACMMFPEDTIVNNFAAMLKFFHTTNTGITVCEREKEYTFKLLTWNDYAHLS